MGKVNALWQDAVDAVLSKVAQQDISQDDAIIELIYLGVEIADAHDSVDFAYQQGIEDNSQFGVGS